MLLAAASFFVFDPFDVAGPLNAAIFGLTIFASRALSAAAHSLPLPHPLGLSCHSALHPLDLNYLLRYVRSTLFFLFVTLSLLHTDYFLHQGKRSSLLWAAVFTALACLTRYIGLTLPMTIVPLLLLQRNTGSVAKVKHIAVYTLISVPPIALWMLRNFLLSGSPAGHTPPRQTLPYRKLLDSRLNALSRWVFLDLPLGEFHQFRCGIDRPSPAGTGHCSWGYPSYAHSRKWEHGLTGVLSLIFGCLLHWSISSHSLERLAIITGELLARTTDIYLPCIFRSCSRPYGLWTDSCTL